MIGSSVTLSEAQLREAESLVNAAFSSDDIKEGQASFM